MWWLGKTCRVLLWPKIVKNSWFFCLWHTLIRLGIDQLPTREGEGYHLLPSRHMKPAACVPPELLLMQRQGGVTHSEASTICPILHAQTLSLLASVAVIDGEESMASFALFGRGWLWHLWDSYLRSMDDQANTFFFFSFSYCATFNQKNQTLPDLFFWRSLLTMSLHHPSLGVLRSPISTRNREVSYIWNSVNSA